MHEQLEHRLAELKKDFTEGQARLQELESQQTLLRDTLLRISGAIQVIEEMLASQSERAPGAASSEPRS
jgi:predicted nuclease with TOPRIM domain